MPCIAPELTCCALLLLGLATAALGEEPPAPLSVSFARDAWDPTAWVIAKNPTVPHHGGWVQRDSCIENATPADPALVSSLDHTLTTMVYARPFAGDLTVSSTIELGPGAAPGIVIAQDWAPDAEQRPQYGEFYEVIIFQQGVNLWHHFTRDGQPTYELAAYCRFELQPDTPYKLTVQRQAQTLDIAVDGHRIGVLIPPLASELFLGVEGCEGICRIHDFTVTR